ncbi:MAG: BTAD domain-containing putative transcriptional regulator, partial [Longimicrobiales bacterium]
MLLRLTTLGAARVYGGDVEFPDLPAQRLRFALLLYLALERDISREEVLAMFWPERDAARGKHALRQMLYELRQVLGEDWIELRRDRILVRASVDATEFEDAVTGGRVEDALRVYGGAFLLGFSLDNRSFEGWADRRRAHLARLHRRLQRENVAALAAAGSTDAALAAARRWVELDPVDDEAAHTLIERLAAAGQRTAALQYYDNYERQLAAELDVEPLEATRALVASIRAGEPVSGAHNVQPAGEGIVSDGAAPSAPAPAAATTSTFFTTAASTGSAPVSISHPVTAAAPAPASPARRTLPARWADALLNRRTGVTVALVTPVLLLLALVARPGTDRSLAELPPARIAVLPFADHSAEASLVPLSNALTETLAHSLAASRFLDIISPNGVLLLRSQGAAEDSLGRLLGADYLVGGSISRGEDWVRVDVELLDGRTGSVVRTEVVERPWTESRILVDDVVRRAATFLRREVGAQVEVRRVRAHTRSEDA